MTSTASLTLTLRRGVHDDDYTLRTLEFLRGEVRHRLSITGRRVANDVLQPELADVVTQAIDGIDRDRALVSSPDSILSLPGLVLGRMYVMASDAGGADEHAIMVKFRDAVGSFQCAMLDDFGFDSATASLRDEIETRLLADVATPVITLLAGLERIGLPLEAAGTVEARLDRLAQDRDELMFYLDLLKRYAQNHETRHAFVERMVQARLDAQDTPASSTLRLAGAGY